MIVSIPDGTELLVRHIRPDDKALLVDGLARLSPQSVYRRFLAPKQRFSNGELRYLTELDGNDHVALVALPPDDPDHLVAVARLVRLAGDRQAAEVAIVVGDDFQGRGLGRLMALRLADEARERDIRRFEATILGENEPARRLMGTMAQRLDSGAPAGAAVELSAELPAAA
ncbi:MAG: GNAT family N-acetyltransferase [Thermoleophilaceae bacterium]